MCASECVTSPGRVLAADTNRIAKNETNRRSTPVNHSGLILLGCKLSFSIDKLFASASRIV